MPTSITETSTFTASLSVPTDTEGATSASLKDTFVQGLANRTKYLNGLTGTTGVKKLREVADLTALAALTGNSANDKCYVPGYGIYRFETPAISVNSPWVVNPASGSFVHELNSLIASKIATIASGKLVQPAPGLVIASDHIFGSTPQSTGSGTYIDATAASVAIASCAVGDVMFVTGTAELLPGSSALQEAHAQLLVDDTGGLLASRSINVVSPGATVAPLTVPLIFRRVIAVAGTRTVKIQIKTGGSGTMTINAFDLAVIVYRP